ncbi:MAG: hypothetical protein L6407_06415 [Candidatus Delongbacteria bacterium]|nr:hypothetical protein [Candidatus Delongbacteria bacterium]
MSFCFGASKVALISKTIRQQRILPQFSELILGGERFDKQINLLYIAFNDRRIGDYL